MNNPPHAPLTARTTEEVEANIKKKKGIRHRRQDSRERATLQPGWAESGV